MEKRSDLHRWRELSALTVHQELVLLGQEGLPFSKEMYCEDMISGTTLVTLDCEWPGLVLHGKIGPNGSCAITNEVVSGGKSFVFEQDTEEVVEGFLTTRR